MIKDKAELIICTVSGRRQVFYECEITRSEMYRLQKSFYYDPNDTMWIKPLDNPGEVVAYNANHIESITVVIKPLKEDK